jgi:phosphoglucosamine mutase
MITTLGILSAIREAGRPLHELTAGFQTFPQILVNVKVKVKRPFTDVASIRDAALALETRLGSRGRLLLRYSGTEPLARIMIEGESQSEIEKWADELAEVIEKSLGV